MTPLMKKMLPLRLQCCCTDCTNISCHCHITYTCVYVRDNVCLNVGYCVLFVRIQLSPNSTWLVTSRHDTIRHVRRVEPMHFGCVELVEQHGSSRLARHVERVET